MPRNPSTATERRKTPGRGSPASSAAGTAEPSPSRYAASESPPASAAKLRRGRLCQRQSGRAQGYRRRHRAGRHRTTRDGRSCAHYLRRAQAFLRLLDENLVVARLGDLGNVCDDEDLAVADRDFAELNEHAVAPFDQENQQVEIAGWNVAVRRLGSRTPRRERGMPPRHPARVRPSRRSPVACRGSRDPAPRRSSGRSRAPRRDRAPLAEAPSSK